MLAAPMSATAKPVRTFRVDALDVHVFATQPDLASFVALHVRDHLASTIQRQGSAAAILATGNSQIQFLKNLVALGGIDWSRVTLFHMDEYLGISGDHPASFRRYMREKVESLVHPKAFHYLQGDCDLPHVECARYRALLESQAIDLCCLGVGENGHLAFNDPHVARLDDSEWVKAVRLDDACKMQQVKEGHFPSLEAVPPYALTLTIPALMTARKVVCVAPEKRKAIPVRDLLQGPVSSLCPASALRRNPAAVLLIDEDSSSLL
jgi:glucosamine-6-phosphate deaminase